MAFPFPANPVDKQEFAHQTDAGLFVCTYTAATNSWSIEEVLQGEQAGGSYVLPPATTTTLGGVIVGSNLTVSPLGRLDALSGGTVTSVSGSAPIQVANGTSTPAISISPASSGAPGSMSAADKLKLDGVQAGATANSTDAQLRDRSTHTGTQSTTTLSDFPASSRAQTEAMFTAGTNVTLTPSGSGATRSIQISATAGGGGVAAVTGTAPIVSSGGGSPAISINPATTSAPGSMSAADKAKLDGIAAGATANAGTVTSVTGNTPISVTGNVNVSPVISIGIATQFVAGSMSSADKLKLDGIAAGATANSTDAQLRDRSTHTGSQAASTISDFNATARGQVEGALTAGANITLTSSGTGATRTITIAAAGGGGGPTMVAGTAAMGTAAIASGAHAATVTVAAAGVTTADVLTWGFNGNPNGVTGYNAASTTGCLVITAFPTAGNVNFVVSNPTGASITPGALTLNWRVVR